MTWAVTARRNASVRTVGRDAGCYFACFAYFASACRASVTCCRNAVWDE